jgi:hypothetical protein
MKTLSALSLLLFACGVQAQTWNDVDHVSPPPYTAGYTGDVIAGNTVVVALTDAAHPAGAQSTLISLSDFATAASVDINSDAIATNANGIQANAQEIVTIQEALANLEHDIEIGYQGTALGAALVSTMPKKGDRFSFNVNVAEFEGELGAGATFGFAPNDRVMFHIGHARSNDTHLTRGGFSLSW